MASCPTAAVLFGGPLQRQVEDHNPWDLQDVKENFDSQMKRVVAGHVQSNRVVESKLQLAGELTMLTYLRTRHIGRNYAVIP
jgi:hypothetical protein